MLVPTFLYPLLEAVILLFCGFKSFKAIESKGEGTDDTKWLTFWLVYTVTSFAKAILDLVSILIPLYNELNLALIVYLAFFGGAQKAYTFLQPLLKEHEKLIDAKIDQAKIKAQELYEQNAQKLTAAASSGTKKDS